MSIIESIEDEIVEEKPNLSIKSDGDDVLKGIMNKLEHRYFHFIRRMITGKSQ